MCIILGDALHKFFYRASIKAYLVIAFFVAISFVLVITLTTFLTLKQSFDYKFYNLKYWENFDNKMLVKSFISGNFGKDVFNKLITTSF